MADVSYNHPAAWDVARLLKESSVEKHRVSGPGGQHRNKVETAVRVRHQPTGVVGAADERRSQKLNHDQAVFRLRVNLALGVRQPVDAAGYIPSDLWRSRCKNSRVVVSAAHEDFPALLAEAIDVLAARGFDPRAAGQVLGCTASQLVKLLKAEPRAMGWVNQQRLARGEHRLS